MGILVKFDFSYNRNQYLVSLASLLAIEILQIKSFLDCAAVDSSTFAPILVPYLSNCFDKTSSFSFLNLYTNQLYLGQNQTFYLLLSCFSFV